MLPCRAMPLRGLISGWDRSLIIQPTSACYVFGIVTTFEKNTILFTLLYRDDEYRIQTRNGQYHSLMGLISDQLPMSGFGLCSGMGSCGTCLVVIDGMPALSCAVQVNDDLANTRVEVMEEYF
jgi:hypothetical protein